MGLLQEKFQTIADRPPSSSHEWASAESARRTRGVEHGTVTESNMNGGKLNCLPPGQNISDQELANTYTPKRVMGGETDVSRDWNPGAVEKGYTRLKMRPTDDAYNNEHYDLFYGEATVDGDTGFVERGNTMDRL